MKSNQKIHQATLTKWTSLFQEQADSGLTIKEWCMQMSSKILHGKKLLTMMAKSSYRAHKREDLLEGLLARIYDHELSKDELKELFSEGYKELPVEIYKRLSVIPETYMVDEHHVHVYTSKKNDGRIVSNSQIIRYRLKFAPPPFSGACGIYQEVLLPTA